MATKANFRLAERLQSKLKFLWPNWATRRLGVRPRSQAGDRHRIISGRKKITGQEREIDQNSSKKLLI
jgi:hypothetical protein